MKPTSATSGATALPSGAEFLHLVADAENACIALTASEIPALGISVPACYQSLPEVLSLLYAEASCSYGCAGGDHFWQRLVARVVSHSLAALRLAMMGYYDESIALIRNIAETTNLLFLFAASPSEVARWRSGTEKERWQTFRPIEVRKRLKKLNLTPPIDDAKYGLLCEVGVHVTPDVSPQAFNAHERASLGASFIDTALIATINELSTVVAESAGCISALPLMGQRAMALRLSAQILLNMIGGLDLNAARKLSEHGA